MKTENYGRLTNDVLFKKVFGQEETKDILIAFLNHMIGDAEIIDVTIVNSETPGPLKDDRKVVFDVACRGVMGEEFIVEMQCSPQEYFRDRALYYCSYPIVRQGSHARKEYYRRYGNTVGFSWNYCLKPVKFIAILDFKMMHGEGWEDDRFYSSYHVREDVTGELLNSKLQFIFLEMGRFNKNIDELSNVYEKWIYLFKNIHLLKEKPEQFSEEVFDRLFDVAKFSNFTTRELNDYQEREKMFNDYQNCLDYAKKLAEEKGLAEGFANGLAQGMTEGHAKGLAEGHAEGLLQGMTEGHAKGLAEGHAEGLVQGMTEGHAKGLAEGHAEGLAEGKNEMREDIAMNLLAEGFPVEKVSQLTGLSKEKCSDLKLSAV